MNIALCGRVAVLAVATLSFLTSDAVAGMSAADILAKVDASANAFADQRFDIEMTLVAADGASKTRTFTMWQKGTTKRLVRFTSGDTKGMAVLIDGPTTMYVYLPGEGKVRRVGMHAASAGMAGSDFGNDDMATIRFQDTYVPKLVAMKGGSAILDLAPKAGAKVTWQRLRLTVDMKTFNVATIEYYDAHDPSKPARIQTRSEIKEVSGKTIASLIVMKNTRTGHRTELRIVEFEVDKGIKDSFFKPRTLMR